MKARLTDGSVVELAKDCDCITHDGPHWLHYDALWRAINQEIKATADLAYAALQAKGLCTITEIWDVELIYGAFASEESRRLDDKLRTMVRLGIEEILKDDTETKSASPA